LTGGSNGSGEIIVVVGDVSGKGTSAALHVSKVQGVMRSLHEFGLTPVELFIRTNRLLCRDLEKKSFVTAIAAAFHSGKRTLHVARAGHLPLYHYRPSTGTITKIIPKGIGLGIDPTEIFVQELEELTIPYAQGDVFVFVTDGITESIDSMKEEFGEIKLEDAIRGSVHHPAKKIRDILLEAVRGFSGSTPQRDDQTVVVVKVE
jgi:serine phosphatase RsbU (regulator of sigma subunit)